MEAMLMVAAVLGSWALATGIARTVLAALFAGLPRELASAPRPPRLRVVRRSPRPAPALRIVASRASAPR